MSLPECDNYLHFAQLNFFYRQVKIVAKTVHISRSRGVLLLLSLQFLFPSKFFVSVLPSSVGIFLRISLPVFQVASHSAIFFLTHFYIVSKSRQTTQFCHQPKDNNPHTLNYVFVVISLNVGCFRPITETNRDRKNF